MFVRDCFRHGPLVADGDLNAAAKWAARSLRWNRSFYIQGAKAPHIRPILGRIRLTRK